MCFIKTILNENGMFMLLKKFKEMYGINTDYIIYIGCVHIILATNIVFMHMGQEMTLIVLFVDRKETP